MGRLMKMIVVAICLTWFLPLQGIAEERPFTIKNNVSDGVLNMRSGPGQQHSLVIAIPAGVNDVMIGDCRAPDDGRSRHNWCKARWSGHSGWVSRGGIVETNLGGVSSDNVKTFYYYCTAWTPINAPIEVAFVGPVFDSRDGSYWVTRRHRALVGAPHDEWNCHQFKSEIDAVNDREEYVKRQDGKGIAVVYTQ